MKDVRFTPAAIDDLSAIWDYTAERWDDNQAENYMLDIRAAVRQIAEVPSRGARCDGIRAGYRRSRVGSHAIFYTETAKSVDIIRVLHQRMDPLRHL